ncbi:MAG: hypothetical protein II969_17750 [Anaerolineaceae bacterium]|nr:hypothetical protein [Anaerolineaceae bacterium]
MTNNDMGPAFGFMLIGMLALLLLTNISRNSNSVLISRALKILDDSFSESIVQNQDISGSFQNSPENEMIPTESGYTGDWSW